jgi:O-antigen ligase
VGAQVLRPFAGCFDYTVPLATAPRRTTRAAALAACALGIVVGEAVLYDGGYSAAPRIAFAALAVLALIAAAVADRRMARAAALDLSLAPLWALAVLGALSAAWTAGSPGDALRWGAVTAGYGAVAVSAAVVARRSWGVVAIAAGICALALVSGLAGLAAAATFSGPYADRAGGAWRPGGTLEYSAALALLQVAALPALLTAMCRGSRAVSAVAAFACAVAAAVIALSGSRAELAMAVVVCALAVWKPAATVRASRSSVAAAVALAAAAGLVAHLVAGGYVAPRAPDPGSGRLLGLAAACVGVAGVWVAGRSLVERMAAGIRAPRRGLVVAVLAVALLAAGGAAAVSTSAPERQGIEPVGGFWHGRLNTWRAAIETFADQPVLGAGADAFVVASARHQMEGPVVFAHDLPLELAAELGLAGLILAAALYAFGARAMWRARSGQAIWLLGPASAAFLVASLVDWPWHLAGSGAVWAAALGGLIASRGFTAPGAENGSGRAPRL